jgi:hypothetical protein
MGCRVWQAQQANQGKMETVVLVVLLVLVGSLAKLPVAMTLVSKERLEKMVTWEKRVFQAWMVRQVRLAQQETRQREVLPVQKVYKVKLDCLANQVLVVNPERRDQEVTGVQLVPLAQPDLVE